MSDDFHVVAAGDWTGVDGRADPVAWCRAQFNLIRDGGVWAVPRSGMIFTREGDRLVLTAEMPWMPEMEGTITPEQLRAQQAGEFESIRRHFAEAGITVTRREERHDHDPA